ncbi:YceD family protein [Spiroplasma apis]|uniref:DUF177 domain-containing protein n=1 Tax=Spiroplasma apis B31 TaxID=1276258 RepID=V5RLA8_SPIAP|nr:YceD family protein [Spiroplasma apis]AHB36600.1 hypothetical protein SAPIS_v1c07550 [Spiroplasma apis B31]
MLKKDIELKKNIDLDLTYSDIDNSNFEHALLKKIDKIEIKGKLVYQDSIKGIYIKAKICADYQALDARDGSEISITNETLDWEDEYFFESKDDQHNIVIGEQFDILGYAVSQIVLNIPINFTKNYGKISFVGKDFKLMSEEEYQQEQAEKLDPRWNKLKDLVKE